jgi:rhamnogalacturonan endolyase
MTLREDAAQYADPKWNAAFYDSIAPKVLNYVPTSNRTTWKIKADLPPNAKNPIAVLAQNGVDFQDNVFDTKAYQYWVNIGANGEAEIPMVKAGVYRLTIYADGIFGRYTQDNINIAVGETQTTIAKWREETSGTEIFRIGTPDMSSGEFLHGYERNETLANKPEQYRAYWGAYDFPTDFPNGVRFKVGQSNVAKDFNYVHWSFFGGKANYKRPQPYYGTGDVNNWTVAFDVTTAQLQAHTVGAVGTFTVQLAGAKTAAGNTDVFNASEPNANLKYTVSINGKDLEPWIIP